MKYSLILIFLVFYLPGISQQQNQWEGRILSKRDSTPVFNAHIYIRDSNIGTSTNEQGFFLFTYPGNDIETQISVSCIGYKPLLIKNPGASTIYLEEDIYTLQEITVRAIDPKEIVKKALENYSNNYYKSDITKNIYYYEYIQANEEPIRKLEVLAKTGSKGFQSNHKNPAFYIYQKRPVFNNDPGFYGGNGVNVLYSLAWTKIYLEKRVLKNFRISLKGRSEFLGFEVYHLLLESIKRPEHTTSIYITVNDYAIIAIKESFHNKPKKDKETEPEGFYFLESVQYVDFIKSETGSWHVNSIDDYRVSIRNNVENKIRRYIKVLSTEEKKIETELPEAGKETDLYDYEVSYNEKFWEDFNAPPIF
ncbi:carboxypeptidase-like regulatory domain-containing protein [Mangrovivirga sp. M17]|uniref:Carboxypeptidase-like regulatory domain-containing protein n=1 Tax=Mangrovivirga halotolerans TaxID=2993936 RepID=A0ABT3RNF6_9BACT|nr:carboxypeptidase-like regulatory domain-containing protein [Mangrovivirga halotolerans]MCX2743336.1 carboxypeptidase-like regulatory domain-containing protein [Mangrovivirga halotolerans]